jgi:glycosyltransferase involved in cell wall biosynthesis
VGGEIVQKMKSRTMKPSQRNFTVTLFIPVKNEIEGLKAIMPRINKDWCDQILVVDGNSTDGSKEFLLESGYHVVDQKGKGVKAAFWEGFELATGDVIIPFSPDGNLTPEDIPKLISKIQEGFSIVVASRYKDGMKSEDDTIASRLANKAFTALINFLFGLRCSDCLNMFKAFYKKHLYDLGIDKLKHEHSEILLLTRGARYGLKISEIASAESKRIGIQGSRAHPGTFGKAKSAMGLLKTIFRDAIFYRPKSRMAPKSTNLLLQTPKSRSL